MGSFNYIVSGKASDCLRFFEMLPHCYSKDIVDECEYGDDGDFWISGECKYLPNLFWLKDQTKTLSLDLKGSYENEDRESDEEPGTYIHIVNGRYAKEDLSDAEMAFLDIGQYLYD